MSHQSDLIGTDINAYLKQHEQKELLRLLTCGSVDDGKSTLIGRLLHDTSMIYEDQLAALESDSSKVGSTGEKLDLSLLVDGLQAEREQGITIDVAYRYFSTAKRKFIMADTPGHEQYTRNMATGASNAQLAVILIDARHGVLTQTKRHSFLASLLGIKHVVVAINKMDLVDYSEQRFNEIREEYQHFCGNLGLEDVRFVPISALEGDNVVYPSENMPWFDGKPMMQVLETVPISHDKDFEHFRFPVQYVNRPNLDFRGFCGTIASGVVKPDDEVVALPSGRSTRVDRVVTFEGDQDEAHIDQAVTLTLKDEIDISRGDMLVHAGNMPEVATAFNANVVWMTDQPLAPGRQYDIKQGPRYTSGAMRRVHYKTDVNTLEQQEGSELGLNEIGLCEFAVSHPLAFDPYPNCGSTGAFIIIDRLTNITIGAGMIKSTASDAEGLMNPVTTEEWQRRLDQKPLIIDCGGEAADKLATALQRSLFDVGKTGIVLDNTNTDSEEDRGSMAEVLRSQGLIVFTTGISGTPADYSVSADNDAGISKAVQELLQTLRREKRLQG
ncbi:sulfate adenylyltransferase subunit CysN [Halovibrio salipaludis]|uniref:Sulfate adenylyltransferase subunit 1 n=1 Tax=Halovibrio salipaludis TaxID=2032626 RepID=A0A2A2F2A2_9GAMM|nr:sulfate adenylyltransferase subunit CysN [Halovibrio salipaludis]PAU78732.1 sulfate adenylyltransferase subunit CysN [Halovibrio salipaludis]